MLEIIGSKLHTNDVKNHTEKNIHKKLNYIKINYVMNMIHIYI